MILIVEELDKSVAISQRHRTLDHLEKEGHEKKAMVNHLHSEYCQRDYGLMHIGTIASVTFQNRVILIAL